MIGKFRASTELLAKFLIPENLLKHRFSQRGSWLVNRHSVLLFLYYILQPVSRDMQWIHDIVTVNK